MTVADPNYQGHWLIGNSVIVRHGDDGTKVRVTGAFAGDPAQRRYRTTLVDADGKNVKFTEWRSLDSALREGEVWLS